MKMERTISLDPHAIDLMAYLHSQGKICPICGRGKHPEKWLCDNCFFVWGKEAIRQIKMEVGRKNLEAWDLLVGPNLRGAHRSHKNINQIPKTTILNDWDIPSRETDPRDYCCRIVKPADPQVVAQIKGSNAENRIAPESTLQSGDSEGKIELAPHTGIYGIKSVLTEMALDNFPQVFICPFCGQLKKEDWWMCSNCTTNQWGQKIALLKWHISQINPRAGFIRWQLLTPEQELAVLKIAVEFLKRKDSQIFIRWPGKFPAIVEAIAINRWSEHTVERFIFAKIAYQAIAMVKESIYLPTTKPLIPIKPAASKSEETDKLSGIKNFRENPRLAQAFFVFMHRELENWRKEQRGKGLSANQKGFFKKAGISSAFFFDLKNHSQGSLKKAEEVAKAFNTTLKKAVCIGLEQITNNQ